MKDQIRKSRETWKKETVVGQSEDDKKHNGSSHFQKHLMEKGTTHREKDEHKQVCIIEESSCFSTGSNIIVRQFSLFSKL